MLRKQANNIQFFYVGAVSIFNLQCDWCKKLYTFKSSKLLKPTSQKFELNERMKTVYNMSGITQNEYARFLLYKNDKILQICTENTTNLLRDNLIECIHDDLNFVKMLISKQFLIPQHINLDYNILAYIFFYVQIFLFTNNV